MATSAPFHMRIAQAAARLLGQTDAAYQARRQNLLAKALSDPAFCAMVGRGDRLPRGYGWRTDERLIEYPWLAGQDVSGRVLDAGSVFNHVQILEHFLSSVDALDIFTLAPEPLRFEDPKVTYMYGDLRDMPMSDNSYDTVCCISTLEHVGMDNSGYGADGARSNEPSAEARKAVQEMARVLRPGGRLLITVPYGEACDHGWLRQFTHAEIEQLTKWVKAKSVDVAVFRYGRTGWRESDLDAAAVARYRDVERESLLQWDGALGARAVACVRFDT